MTPGPGSTAGFPGRNKQHPIQPRHFRRVLGHLPTGVVVVTAVDGSGPVGMAVGTFTSVSLDPPLVGFLPSASSTSFPRIRDAGSFCANVLAAHQEAVCRAFATSRGDKFAGLRWHPANSGAPVLAGVLAWIDCDIEVIHPAGDHFIVIGAVRELDVSSTTSPPLLFHLGEYGAARLDTQH
jgi:3-hydroxy-9,10-secoandrosta-1,3,5(10)-triene-9,17-dione monooxygenase reductase component